MTIKEMFVVLAFGLFVLVFSPVTFGGSLPPECGYDVNKVYQARKSGVPKDALLHHLGQVTDITETRREFIQKLIEDAYSKSADDFADDAFPSCGSSI